MKFVLFVSLAFLLLAFVAALEVDNEGVEDLVREKRQFGFGGFGRYPRYGYGGYGGFPRYGFGYPRYGFGRFPYYG